MAVILPTLLMALALVYYSDAAVDIYQEIEALNTQLAHDHVVKSFIEKLLVTELQTINTKMGRLEKFIVFRATFQNLILDVSPGTVKFDNVLENAGNGYNPSTGYFTAPVGGLYVFTVQAFSHIIGPLVDWDLYTLDSSKVEIQLLRSRGNVKEESTDYTYITSLPPGQIVFVRNLATPGRFLGLRHSFFSGCLVKSF